MQDLAKHIEDYASRLPLVASCRIHNLAGISPNALQSAVENLSLKANGVGVIAVDHPRTRNILRDIVEAGIRLVTLVSDIPAAPRSAYVGIDNRVAGRTAALLMGRFLGGREGHLAMVVGSRSYRGHEEREMGFRSVLGEEFPNLTVTSAVEINDEPDASYAETMKALRNEPELLGIYCVGAGRSGVAKAIREARPNRKPVFICHDLTRETRGYLVDDLARRRHRPECQADRRTVGHPPARLHCLIGALSDAQIHRAAPDLQGKRAGAVRQRQTRLPGFVG